MDDGLVAPVDPRLRLGPPGFGELPQLFQLEDLVTRVLAPNPGLMSLDGTNTYIVSAPGAAEAAIVDPGPADPDHLARVKSALAGLDARCRWILVTHHHLDHAEAALPSAPRPGPTLPPRTPPLPSPPAR